MIHRLFYPQVPAVLSARHRGRVSAMPVVSYVSVSDEPPLVGVGCNPSTFTCQLALKSKAFSLSLLGSAHFRSVEELASMHGTAVKDKLHAVGLEHRRGTKLAVPLIEEAEATLECKLKRSLNLGDHVMLIGEVKAAYATGAFTDFWDFGRYSPILYAGWREGMTTYSAG